MRVEGLASFAAMQSAAKASDYVAIDVETSYDDTLPQRELLEVSLTFDGVKAWTFKPGDWLRQAVTTIKNHRHIYHNGMFDVPVLKYNGYPVRYDEDTMGLAHLINPDHPKGLEAMAASILKMPSWKVADYKVIEDWEDEVRLQLVETDVLVTYRLFQPLSKEARDAGVDKVYNDVLMPGCRELAQMAVHGIPVDRYNLTRLQLQVNADLSRAQRELDLMVQTLTGRETINVNSSKQVAGLLYDDLRLPVLAHTDTGAPSSGAAVLKRLAVHNEVASKILEVRLLRKSKSAFLDAWPKLMTEQGYLHPTISPLRVVTGRTKSDGPNIQQVPRDKRFRNVFGGVGSWIKADYSQIELRIAAWLANEENMLEAYRNDEDLHTKTAELVLGDPAARQVGKTLNFGLLYGAGPNKLLEIARDQYNVKLTPDQARQYHRGFFEAYPALKDWHREIEWQVTHRGFVRSPLGRVRYLPDGLGIDDTAQWAAVREGMNMPVQSMASDLLLRALGRVGLRLGVEDCRPVAAVHDEIDFICRSSRVDEAVPIIKATMEETGWLEDFGIELTVPIVADIEVGTHWGDVQ